MKSPELEFYQKQGLSYFPLPHGQKYDSQFKWGEYQKRPPNEAEIKAWFGNGTKRNIAVVCGEVSGNLVILDCDTEERFYELALIICEKLDIDDILDFTRVSKTGKGYHIWLRTNDPVQSMKFPKLDIKGEGGYIVAPPSLHPDGHEYQFLNPLKPIKHVNSLLDIGIDLAQRKETAPLQPGENWISKALQGVTEGDRNDICYRLACHFANSQPEDITTSTLIAWNANNKPPLEINEVLRTVRSAYQRRDNNGVYKDIIYYMPKDTDLESESHKNVTEKVTKPLAEMMREWITNTSGWFSYDEIDKEFELKTSQQKHNRWMILKRLKDDGTIEQHPKDNKRYRHVNVAVRLVDFKAATKRTPLALRYPFGVEKLFSTYPGNIIVLAGAADAGKTGFLLNFIFLNQFDFSIFYQTSEMGKEELASRLDKFEGMDLADWNFTAEERSRDFADVIRPDCINIIDYMELAGDFYAVADYLRAIHDRLAGGVAIVALQKKRGAELGRGGDFALEKPRLYLSMDKGQIKIQKCKNWADPTENPNGMILNFKIVNGCKFITTQDWHAEE